MIKKTKSKPMRWSDSDKAIRATQVAFDIENEIIAAVKKAACQRGIAPSDMIREIVGLKMTVKPVRPRLTMSLKEDDYHELAKKYGLQSDERLAIKSRMIEEIRKYAERIK